jgi:RNA polymerase sigma factor for flagellar operon FliA
MDFEQSELAISSIPPPILALNKSMSRNIATQESTLAQVSDGLPERASVLPMKLEPAAAAKLTNRDRIIVDHLPLVKAIAVRVHENLPVHVDVDDLIHAGVLGLFDAVTKYDPDKQVAFSSYAKHRIKGAILDSLRQLDWASRDLRRRHRQVEVAVRELSSKLQRNPTEMEIAEAVGVDIERLRQMMLDLHNVGLMSSSARPPENDELPPPDFASKPETQPDQICAQSELKAALKTAMQSLPERYRRVVTLYYSKDMTMKEIGGVLGINESRVSQIHKSALEKMQTFLQSSGVHSSQAF